MNVASVTVTAITQGLIVPSGIRNLARILFRMTLAFLPPLLRLYYVYRVTKIPRFVCTTLISL